MKENAQDVAVEKYLQEQGIKYEAQYAGEGTMPHSDDKVRMDAWKVLFSSPKGGISRFDYYTGMGHRELPKSKELPFRLMKKREGPAYAERWKDGNMKPVSPPAAGVLYSILSDAGAGKELFEDFCANFGYDSDSRKAFRIYEECQKSAAKLRILLTSEQTEVLEKLLNDCIECRLLGMLGSLVHLRCKACGWVFEAKEVEVA